MTPAYTISTSWISNQTSTVGVVYKIVCTIITSAALDPHRQQQSRPVLNLLLYCRCCFGFQVENKVLLLLLLLPRTDELATTQDTGHKNTTHKTQNTKKT